MAQWTTSQFTEALILQAWHSLSDGKALIRLDFIITVKGA
ncbi:hypothetical protein Bealeia2_02066 (plasmid) [Candidatus Bealeia paramacronuclearis]|nr:hypothetical protein [Candidatus Bealeia paramacronuclearis]